MRKRDLQLIIELVKRDFTDRFAGSIFGNLWVFALPFVNILIYTVIFSRLMNARLANVSNHFAYTVYLIIGILSWTAFSNTLSRGSTSFIRMKHIVTKINLPLPVIPFYITLSECVTFTISLIFFYFLLAIIRYPVTKYHLLLPLIFIIQQVFAYSLGLIFAIFTVFIRDLKEVVSIAMQILFWMTPIVYVKSVIPAWLWWVVSFNPVTVFVEAFHSIVLWNKLPDLMPLSLVTILTFVLFLCAFYTHKKLQQEVKDSL